MKKITIVAITLLALASCTDSGEENKKSGMYEKQYDAIWGSMEYKIEERTIDSCEYIIIFGMEGRNIIHKANCKNTFHACK